MAASAGQGALIFAAIAIVVVALLAYDRARHPLKRCRPCRGSGKKYSPWNGEAYGACRRCAGAGEVPRLFGRKK